jgi:phosphoesterase RecJ-like protein
MLAAAGAAMSDTEGFVDYAASIDDVELAALFREVGENEIRVSLRSRNDNDVASLAEKLGGGGHRNAAGLTIHGDLATATTLIVNALGGMLSAGNGSKKSA